MTTEQLTRTPDAPLADDPDFRRLFAAAAMSGLGTQVGYVAMPLVAVSALDATAGQVGILAMLSTIAFLVIGLPAGAWVDRVHRRPVMIAADIVRAALFGSVPLAWWLGGLTLIQLYAVVLLAGVCTVFFDVAAQSYLPHVVNRDRLTSANSALVSMHAISDVSGRSAGGFLVQALTAPVSILSTPSAICGRRLSSGGSGAPNRRGRAELISVGRSARACASSSVIACCGPSRSWGRSPICSRR